MPDIWLNAYKISRSRFEHYNLQHPDYKFVDGHWVDKLGNIRVIELRIDDVHSYYFELVVEVIIDAEGKN